MTSQIRLAYTHKVAVKTQPDIQRVVDGLYENGTIDFPIEVRYWGVADSGAVQIQLIAIEDPPRTVGKFFTSKVLDSWESTRRAKLTPDCMSAFTKVRRKYKDVGLWAIEWAFLNDDRLWGHGIGRIAYEQIMSEAGSFGAVVLPQGCRPGGNTTPAAMRVWESVKKRHRSEGPIVIPNNLKT